MGITSKTGFHDWFLSSTKEERLNAKIYCHDGFGPLKITKEEDLTPYFGFLIASMSSNKENKITQTTINLSKDDEFLSTDLRHINYIISNCVKITFNKFVLDKKKVPSFIDSYLLEQVKKILDKGNIQDVFDSNCISSYRLKKYEEWYNLITVDHPIKRKLAIILDSKLNTNYLKDFSQ